MATPSYIIGIDLGTTNSVVAYTEAEVDAGQQPAIKLFRIPQLVDAGVVEQREMLPSFLLAPGKHDVSETAKGLSSCPGRRTTPWQWENLPAIAAPNCLIASFPPPNHGSATPWWTDPNRSFPGRATLRLNSNDLLWRLRPLSWSIFAGHGTIPWPATMIPC